MTPPSATNPIRVRVEVLSDTNKNLAEYWANQAGNALLVDSEQLSASLRILRKNGLITTKMGPEITCKSEQETTVEFDGFRVAAQSTALDGGVRLKTQFRLGPYSDSVDANAILSQRRVSPGPGA